MMKRKKKLAKENKRRFKDSALPAIKVNVIDFCRWDEQDETDDDNDDQRPNNEKHL